MQTVTSAIKHYFRVMAEPLLVNALYLDFMNALELPEDGRVAELRRVVAKLPPANLNLLTFFLKHLIRVAERANENKMKASNLGVVFGPTLIKAPEELAARALTDFAQCNLLVELFVDRFDAIFGEDADVVYTDRIDDAVAYATPGERPALTLVDGDEMYAAPGDTQAPQPQPQHSYEPPIRLEEPAYAELSPAGHPYSAPAPRSAGVTAVALYDYTAEDPNDISFTAGQTFQQVSFSEEQPGWVYAFDAVTQRCGRALGIFAPVPPPHRRSSTASQHCDVASGTDTCRRPMSGWTIKTSPLKRSHRPLAPATVPRHLRFDCFGSIWPAYVLSWASAERDVAVETARCTMSPLRLRCQPPWQPPNSRSCVQYYCQPTFDGLASAAAPSFDRLQLGPSSLTLVGADEALLRQGGHQIAPTCPYPALDKATAICQRWAGNLKQEPCTHAML